MTKYILVLYSGILIKMIIGGGSNNVSNTVHQEPQILLPIGTIKSEF